MKFNKSQTKYVKNILSLRLDIDIQRSIALNPARISIQLSYW